MASTATKPEREPRKEGYTREGLAVVLRHLNDRRRRMATLLLDMEKADLAEVQIDGHKMLMRGLQQIDAFIDNGSRAVREASWSGR